MLNKFLRKTSYYYSSFLSFKKCYLRQLCLCNILRYVLGNYSVLFYGEASAWPLVSKRSQLPYLTTVGLLLISCKKDIIYLKPSILLWQSGGNPFQKVLAPRGGGTLREILRHLGISQARVLHGWPNAGDGERPSQLVRFVSLFQPICTEFVFVPALF